MKQLASPVPFVWGKDLMIATAEFETLFRGSLLAHGTFNGSTKVMATLLTPASSEDFSKHLSGELGLGIVPVDQEGKCWWGAIDIDVDTIDHNDLYKRVKERNLPLSVCRSKSGGAHLIVFFMEPQTAPFVQGLLRKWASLLGYPSKTEIFPKQTRSTVENVGNWLNLPYFAGDKTTRYAIGERGSMSLDEFLSTIDFYTGKERINESITNDLIQIELMPPCLKTLTAEGLAEGERNSGLFNFGVFYKKSSPNGWQDKLRYHSKNFVSSSFGHEVESIIKSLASRDYQYKCNEEPICSRCDRKTCVTLQFGVTHRAYEDEGGYDVVGFQNLRKIKTDPPTFILEVNSMDVTFNSTQLKNFKTFKDRVEDVTDLVIKPMKQAQWDVKRKALLASVSHITAPENASEDGAILDVTYDFLGTHDKSSSVENLQMGAPWLDKGKVYFKVEYLQKYIHTQRKKSVDNQHLYAVLQKMGCVSNKMVVKGKEIEVWSMPLKNINAQTEHFTPVKMEKPKEEM